MLYFRGSLTISKAFPVYEFVILSKKVLGAASEH